MRILCQINRLLSLALLTGGFPVLASADVTVFAATSLKEALESVAQSFEAQSGHQVRISFAGTSALARQIEFGAPADVFISANPDWMDHLEAEGLLVAGTRRDILGNQLVVIAPAATDAQDLTPEEALATYLGDGPLAMAFTNAVPAGIYGKAALEALELWDDIVFKVAETDNVRAALALVALRAAPLGIVYATDAKAEHKVATLAVFPERTHPKIVYPVAALGSEVSTEVGAFLEFLTGQKASEVFRQFGFKTDVGS